MGGREATDPPPSSRPNVLFLCLSANANVNRANSVCVLVSRVTHPSPGKRLIHDDLLVVY